MFNNTEIAFKSKSTRELKFMRFIFRLMGYPTLINSLSYLAKIALKIRLPIQWIIKGTIFKLFCGGENIEECSATYKMLKINKIEAILDYSVEGQSRESEFDDVKKQLLLLVENAKKYAKTPTTCMKITGIADFKLLEKITSNLTLTAQEKTAYNHVIERLDNICKKAYSLGVKIYIDAEESWIQPAIDRLTEVMIQRYNSNQAIVFATLQMYRHDRLGYLKKLIQQNQKQQRILGVKIVRGAYLEKENLRAIEHNYPTPIQSTKENTDNDYNTALDLILENIECIELCAGTHNEKSSAYLVELMRKKKLSTNHPNIFFSQLFGMSDNISFNLAHLGYNVSKYLPYGPVPDTLPYLIRRAQENTSVAGQMGRELSLINREINRRFKQYKL